jgi:hypothetical protein
VVHVIQREVIGREERYLKRDPDLALRLGTLAAGASSGDP